jgi:hypothetical protein
MSILAPVVLVKRLQFGIANLLLRARPGGDAGDILKVTRVTLQILDHRMATTDVHIGSDKPMPSPPNREPETLDQDMTPGDIAEALRRLKFSGGKEGKATVRVDRPVCEFLVHVIATRRARRGK